MLTGETTLIEAGTDMTKSVIAYPSVSPDGQWVVYGRMSWEDPSTYYNLTSFQPPDNPVATTSDLYLASTKTPGVEIRLANLDGDGYPFAAGARDLHLNFEPTFAPVAAGGYFWVVYLSRRTYGDILTGASPIIREAALGRGHRPEPDRRARPQPPRLLASRTGRDLAQPPRLLGAQPVRGRRDLVHDGHRLLRGYCNPGGGEAGAATCSSTSPGCSMEGNKCTTTADCCDAASGVTCINKVCSAPTPK